MLLNNEQPKKGGEEPRVETFLQRAKGSCGKSKCARWPDSLSRRSYFRRQDLFNSENATHIPAAQTATAQKSPRHYNANVVGGFDFFQPLQRSCSLWQPRRRSSPGVHYPAFHASPYLAGVLEKAERVLSVNLKLRAVMDETDIMDLTHQKARKRPRPISSVDESVHASLKRLPIRAAECREPSLMFAVRGEPIPAASLKQNDHSVTSSPTTVMPAQVNA